MSETSSQHAWTSYVALSTAVMAVLAGVTTLYMGKFSSRAMLSQGLESDQWAYYQAKSIKAHIFELEGRHLQLEYLAQKDHMAAPAAAEYRKTIDDYAAGGEKYEKEKGEIKTKAEDLEAQKGQAQKRGGNFGYSLLFLQTAIMLSSVAALTKRKALFLMGLVLLAGWAFFFSDAIWLFY